MNKWHAALVEIIEDQREGRRVGADVEDARHKMDRVALVLRQLEGCHSPTCASFGLALALTNTLSVEVVLLDPAVAILRTKLGVGVANGETLKASCKLLIVDVDNILDELRSCNGCTQVDVSWCVVEEKHDDVWL